MKVRGIVYLLLIFMLVAGCGDDSDRSVNTGGSNPAPEVTVLSSTISANLMPLYPPDPIDCSMTLSIENSSEFLYTGLSIPSCSVFLSKDGSYLGKFRFRSEWDGILEPGKIDTFAVVKIQEDAPIFEPLCGEMLYMDIKLDTGFFRRVRKRTGDIFFLCVY